MKLRFRSKISLEYLITFILAWRPLSATILGQISDFQENKIHIFEIDFFHFNTSTKQIFSKKTGEKFDLTKIFNVGLRRLKNFLGKVWDVEQK